MSHSFTLLRHGKSRLLAALLTATVLAATPLSGALAQETHIAISPSAYGATRTVNIETNKTVLLDLPAGAAEVIVSQPSVAAAIMRTRTRAILQGIEGGSTNIFFLDDQGRTISVLDVRVAEPESGMGRTLEAALNRVIPNSNIRVEALTGDGGFGGGRTQFILTGSVQTAEDKAVAEELAASLSGTEPGGSLIQVIGAQQVMLQVTVSEVNRTVAKQLGVNLSGSVSIGSASLGFNNAMPVNTVNGLQGNFPIGDVNIDASIRALESRNALRVLAQPTLTAISGQPAEFHAGGEFPITISDGNGNSTVQYKDYGVQLSFTPVVKSNGAIGLTVDTSVSEVQAGTFALTSRSSKTTVELPAGQTLAIGGLLQESASTQIDQLPGLGNIPILGALFRSREYQSQETELVILVTPYLVAPSPANSIPVPTDASVPATDAEGIFLGKLENLYGVGQTGSMRGSISGSVGFVLD